MRLQMQMFPKLQIPHERPECWADEQAAATKRSAVLSAVESDRLALGWRFRSGGVPCAHMVPLCSACFRHPCVRAETAPSRTPGALSRATSLIGSIVFASGVHGAVVSTEAGRDSGVDCGACTAARIVSYWGLPVFL